MKKFIKKTSLFLIIALVLSCMTFNVSSEDGILETEFGNFYIHDNFLPGSILVYISDEYSEMNKKWDLKQFPEIDAEKIVDLTDVSDGWEERLAKDKFYLNVDDYLQVLELSLKDDEKETVLNAIEKLQNNKFVAYAEPNYIF